jgi:hypothetical protein
MEDNGNDSVMEEEDDNNNATLLVSVLYFTYILTFLYPKLFGFHLRSLAGRTQETLSRARIPVSSIFRQLGSYYTPRAYRMDALSFWRLHRLLRPYLGGRIHPRSTSKKKNRNGAKNGIISSTIRLAAALRYFAGSSVYDIALIHGISVTEVHQSVWQVVNAVNKCSDLKFEFPEDWAAQRLVAAGFEKKSRAGFSICAGAIDGLLIWIEKPTEYDCELAKCGAKKFFCGRKKKFGLNMQGTCDSHGRFLDVMIEHPGATSDYLAFSTSVLKHKLERNGFLAPELTLFGDNAYVNTSYMATPYKGASAGTKDNYNFYQSQVRINIECAFGMFVHRWGILRKPIPSNIGMNRTTALVMCLSRLHNFCIDSRLGKVPVALLSDEDEIAIAGGIMMQETGQEALLNEALLNGGDHFDDVDRAHLCFDERERDEHSHKRVKFFLATSCMILSSPRVLFVHPLLPGGGIVIIKHTTC